LIVSIKNHETIEGINARRLEKAPVCGLFIWYPDVLSSGKLKQRERGKISC